MNDISFVVVNHAIQKKVDCGQRSRANLSFFAFHGESGIGVRAFCMATALDAVGQDRIRMASGRIKGISPRCRWPNADKCWCHSYV